jgi:hypothetical protein
MDDNKIVVDSAIPLDKELLDHIEEFDKEAHAAVKRMIILEHTDKDFERIHHKLPTWDEFLRQKMSKLGIRKKGLL